MPGATITFQWDEHALAPLINRGLDRAVLTSLTYAGRDAIRALKVAANRGVRSRKKLRVRTVNAALRVGMPRDTKSIGDLAWRLDADGSPIRVSDYPYKEVRGVKGVRGSLYAQINVGKWVLIRSAFEATVKAGTSGATHIGVFRRIGRSRLPIKQLYSTRVTDVVNDITDGLLWTAQQKFDETFDRVLPLEVEKALGGHS